MNILQSSPYNPVWQEVAKNLPSLILTLFLIIDIICFRKQFVSLLDSLALRIKSGVQLRIGSVEIGALDIQKADSSHNNSIYEIIVDGERNIVRNKYYEDCRGVMLVHKVFRSLEASQYYDLLIYVIPHNNSTLIQVKSVEYFLGPHWNNQVFKTRDRSKGFAIKTSAFGEFLCTTKIIFTDGQEITINRYIDFEMGGYAPLIKGERK
ncbi:hypothetical protein SAMN05660909_05471 [Chitinophaga terrae (ex Kim and Jung 2007)]|uniref:Prokaryotic YEATS domain-containing protein n=1 Tax=Chitinophaga terrae (ex Kim and Jung 2007) TaxID=408074 RepID=A0A1H4GLD9_9BACT|nr:pYEATS domain-containing protein [Chitinophaga terrae (ex Kim and Jung 2007)]GEP93564.1 hypothetical protein CTE07_52090 [Chitinophaga terrae (ex Kim and Jung 2007)]SEB10384.1 hypothetical protein SAMN05660909_05471 [Chitinophaga terrae (ex Kim and Jung 2007)]